MPKNNKRTRKATNRMIQAAADVLSIDMNLRAAGYEDKEFKEMARDVLKAAGVLYPYRSRLAL